MAAQNGGEGGSSAVKGDVVEAGAGFQLDADGSQVPDVARLAVSEKISCASLWIAASLNIYRMETAV
jgi:hypothetical protein